MAAPPDATFLSKVYWGEHTPGEILARRVVTPSLTAEETGFYTYGTANLVNVAPVPTSAELPVRHSVIEITSANLAGPLPASLVEAGVTVGTDAQSLRERGYGLTLGEHAAYWKSHKGQARRVFTNSDLHHN